MRCLNCRAQFNKKYNFCPFCGQTAINPQEELEQFGMLGRTDLTPEELNRNQRSNDNLKAIDYFMNSVLNGFMKGMENTQINNTPNGIKIKIGLPAKKQQEMKTIPREISQEQIKKMSALPREVAKTSIKRIGDKILYELNTPGVISPEDIFISKLESGYEIKAIGDKKVYINSLPVNLPIKTLMLNQDRLLVEFMTKE